MTTPTSPEPIDPNEPSVPPAEPPPTDPPPPETDDDDTDDGGEPKPRPARGTLR